LKTGCKFSPLENLGIWKNLSGKTWKSGNFSLEIFLWKFFSGNFYRSGKNC
jgi:hypothetical protein